jgi:hypothetical protein
MHKIYSYEIREKASNFHNSVWNRDMERWKYDV